MLNTDECLSTNAMYQLNGYTNFSTDSCLKYINKYVFLKSV